MTGFVGVRRSGEIRSLSAALLASLLLHTVAPAADARDREPLPRQRELTRDQYVKKLAAQVQRSLFYPEQALRDRRTGEAVVRIALAAEGNVLSAVIARSSGNGALDQAAVTAVLRASPFAPTPVGVPNPMNVDVEVVFGLRKR